ncbi:hypothetical protein ACG7TL_006178 [Trametes sanguinea]
MYHISRLKETPDLQPVVTRRHGSSRLKEGDRVGTTNPAESSQRAANSPATVHPIHMPGFQTARSTAPIQPRAEISTGFAASSDSTSSAVRLSPSSAYVSTNSEAEDYWHALTVVGGVFRLDPEQYVLQDWDSKEGLIRTYITELEALPAIASFPLAAAVFIQATPFRDALVYSCRYESGKRVIVSYQREGRWHCQSCRYTSTCKHVPHAMEHARLSGWLTGATDGAVPLSNAADDVGDSEGPDLGPTGVFNWNNRFLFTHELLNAYTNTFTASETPFSAFCLTMRRQYEDKDAKMKFCSDETFVRAWFAFVQLQDLGNSMTCPTCGPSPSIVIADGVTLATHASKLTAGVRPPTLTDATSEVVDSISSYKARGLAAITQKDVRALVIKFVEGVAAGPLADMSLVPDLSSMAQTYPALSAFLTEIVRTSNKELRQVYRDFARQLVPYRAVSEMFKLAQTGTAAVWLQAHIPALGRIIAVLRAVYPAQPIPHIIRTVVKWLATRTEDVYTRLAQHDASLPRVRPLTEGDDWRVTGTCYGLPTVRTRRVYSKLRHDGDAMADINVEDAGECNKFFKTYARNKLAGGILALWCTHSICLGFHTIPIAEGRNDVFSAIYTHFPTAPEVVIYDFACQLAPYCYIREARYFANTRFLIDELHAHDHTRCGQACFASNMMQHDERIRAVNTSAAECGNKGVGRIRKSVSYMSYKHAVIYTKVFVDVNNRIKARKLAGSTH